MDIALVTLSETRRRLLCSSLEATRMSSRNWRRLPLRLVNSAESENALHTMTNLIARRRTMCHGYGMAGGEGDTKPSVAGSVCRVSD